MKQVGQAWLLASLYSLKGLGILITVYVYSSVSSSLKMPCAQGTEQGNGQRSEGLVWNPWVWNSMSQECLDYRAPKGFLNSYSVPRVVMRHKCTGNGPRGVVVS